MFSRARTNRHSQILLAAASVAALAVSTATLTVLSADPAWAYGDCQWSGASVSTWSGTTGNWTDSSWANGMPNSKTQNVCITNASGNVTYNSAAGKIDNLQLDFGNVLNVTNSSGASAEVDIYGSTLDNAGTINITSTSKNYYAEFGIAGGDTLSLTGGGTISFNYTGAGNGDNNARMIDAGGAFSLTNVNNLIEGGGALGGAMSSFDNQAQGTVLANLNGKTLNLADLGNAKNEGTLEATNGGTLILQSSSLTQFSGGTMTGGTYDALGGTLEITALGSAGGEILTNDANIALSGNGTIEDGAGKNALGALATNNGSLNVGSGATLTTTSATGLTNNGSLYGSGTIVVNTLFNYGNTRPGDSATSPGTLTVKGNFSQGASGTLTIDIGGTGTGQYGQILTLGTGGAGAASLNGTLALQLINGFVLGAGQKFTIVAAQAGITGNFDAFDLNGTACTSGGSDNWNCSNLPALQLDEVFLNGMHYLDINVVPEPGSLLLFGSALLGLGWFASRRRQKAA